jgi:hypothetical protein
MQGNREIFADGVGEITLSGGMVRMDLVTMVGSQKDNENQPRLEVSQRIVMPPDGFLRSFSAMEDLVKQLVDAGVIQKRDQVSTQGGTSPNGESIQATSKSKQPPKSPNF